MRTLGHECIRVLVHSLHVYFRKRLQSGTKPTHYKFTRDPYCIRVQSGAKATRTCFFFPGRVQSQVQRLHVYAISKAVPSGF